MLSVGSPGSLVGVSLFGVGVGVTSAAGVGDGDESGVCGKACIPASGVETGDAPSVGGDESGVGGKACSPAIGVETGDAAGTCPSSGNAEIAVKHPTAIKRLLTGTNLLVGILIQ